jgi:hypothetical protein
MSARPNAIATAASVLPLALGIAASGLAPNRADAPPRHAVTASAAAEKAGPGPAVVVRHAVLWSSWSDDATRRGELDVGDVVQVLASAHRGGYLRVATPEEEVGWISERSVKAIDPGDVNQPATPPVAHPPAPGTEPKTTTPLPVTAGLFDGCPPEGDPSPAGSQFQELLVLNREKNRATTPTDADVDRTITLARILQPSSNDEGRFDANRAAEITGYVYDVKPGGRAETGNCRATDAVHRDAHIEITLSPSDTAENRRFIVEITPRWRGAQLNSGVDWSIHAVEAAIEGHFVRVRGWLFFDSEHRGQAENTAPGNASNWRATAWELHPVTAFTIVPTP